MAKSNQNEIVDSRKDCYEETDSFIHCIILNATDELLSKFNRNCVLKIHMFFNDTDDSVRSAERKTQNEQTEFVAKTIRNAEMLRELREKLCDSSTRNSSTQIEGEIINADMRAPGKKDTVNAMTFASQLATILDRIHRENLPRVVKDFAHFRVLLRIYAENARLDNAVPECGCALRNVGIEIQSNTVNGEFNSENHDAPTNARGKKRRADFIPEEIAKVSDTLTAEARLVRDVANEETMLYARKSVMLTADGKEEETFGNKKSLISAIIDVQEKSNNATTTNVAMQQEFFPIRGAGIPRDSSAFSDEAPQVSRLEESLDVRVAEMLLSTEETRTDGDVMSVKHIEKNDSSDAIAAITAVVRSEKKEEGQEEEKESLSEVSLRPAINEDISIIDKTTLDVTVGPMITDSAEKSMIREPTYPAKDTLEESISTEYKIPLSEKTRAIEKTEVRQSSAGEPAPPAQDMFPESVQIKHKMPRHRKTWTAKRTDELETSPVGKPTQPTKDMFQESVQSTYRMPRFKKTQTIKDAVVGTSSVAEKRTQLTKDTFQDSARIKYKMSRFKKTQRIKDTEDETSLARASTPNDVLRKSVQAAHKTARFKRNQTTKRTESCSTSSTFTSFTWPKTTKRSCDHFERSTMGIGQDCRQLKILQPRCCGRSSHCDTSCMRNADLDRVYYPFVQDPCVSRCRSGYWWWGRTCDANSHGKYGATVGNSLHTHAYCNGDTGYYCPHLNAIDNCRTGHCHWNGGRSVWSDDRHYGRS